MRSIQMNYSLIALENESQLGGITVGYEFVEFHIDSKGQFHLSRAITDVKTALKMLTNKDVTFIPVNFTLRNGVISLINLELNFDTLKIISMAVRKYIELKYGTGIKLSGTCIEASKYICGILNYFGFKDVKTVMGFAEYDNPNYGVPKAHVWVESDGTFIDVTAEQFNCGMSRKNKFPAIIIQEGLPHGIKYLDD